MSTIKKISFLLFAFLLVGCFSDDPTGDASILQSNRFLTDENHIIESMTLSNFMELLEEKDDGEITEIDEDDEDAEEVTRDRTDSEMRTIVVFGSISTNYNSLTTSLLNDIVKEDADLKDMYNEIYIVPISDEINEYEKFVAEFVSDEEDDEGSSEEDTSIPNDSVNDYIDLLERVGIKPSYDFELDDQWAFAQLYSDLTNDDKDSENDDDYNLPIEDTDGRIENASYLAQGTVLVFDKENEIESNYLLNSKVEPNFYELYETEDEDGNELDSYELTVNGNCFVFGECDDNESKKDWKGINTFLKDLF